MIFNREHADYLYENVLFDKYYLSLLMVFHLFYYYYIFFIPNNLTYKNDPSICWPFVLTCYLSFFWALGEIATLNFKVAWGVCKTFDFWFKAYYSVQLMVTGIWVWYSGGYSLFIVITTYIVYCSAIGTLLLYSDAWNVQNKVLKVGILIFIIIAFMCATSQTYFYFDDVSVNPYTSFGRTTEISVKSALMSSATNLCLFFSKPIAREIIFIYGRKKGLKRAKLIEQIHGSNITQSTAFSTAWWIKFERDKQDDNNSLSQIDIPHLAQDITTVTNSDVPPDNLVSEKNNENDNQAHIEYYD